MTKMERPATLDRFDKPKSKKDQILDELRQEEIYLIHWKKQKDRDSL